jgi:hypothetical protein
MIRSVFTRDRTIEFKTPIVGHRIETPKAGCVFHGWSCCRCALYPHVCHAADCIRRRASGYACPCCVLPVTATRSSKAARPKRVNTAIRANTSAVPARAFSWLVSTAVELTAIKKIAQRISVRELYAASCIVFSDLKYLRDLPILSVKMFF